MPILLASEVMDLAAASLNDVDKTTYDYTTQIPYLRLALQELQEIFELNSLAVTEQSSADIPVNSGTTKIAFNVTTGPRLPDNLIEPLRLWERTRDTNPWSPMQRREFLPHQLAGTATSNFMYWVWQKNEILLLESNQDNDIKIDYIGSLFPKYVFSNTIIPVINAQNFLAYKIAALITELIERDIPKAGSLNTKADLSLDRISGITIKSKQSIVARHRPFRSAYKRIGWY